MSGLDITVTLNPDQLEAIARHVAELLRADARRAEDRAPERLVTVATAARALGVSERTIRREVAAGRLPAQRIGRAVRVDLTSLGGVLPVGDSPAPRRPRPRPTSGEFSSMARRG
jgi:excisionase family DNA binding protein